MLEDNYFASWIWALSARSVWLPERGLGRDRRESRAGECERQTLQICLWTAPSHLLLFLHPTPLFPPSLTPSTMPKSSPPWPRQKFFLEHLPWKDNKVFSLALLSCDQSIAQEMGSLKSCLSKISYFTSWSILREHSALSLPRANISVTCVWGARLRPHILFAVKENTAPLWEHSFCAHVQPWPPAPLGGHEEILIRLSQEVQVILGRRDWKTKSSKSHFRWECFLLLIKNRVPFLGYSDEPRVNIYAFNWWVCFEEFWDSQTTKLMDPFLLPLCERRTGQNYLARGALFLWPAGWYVWDITPLFVPELGSCGGGPGQDLPAPPLEMIY